MFRGILSIIAVLVVSSAAQFPPNHQRGGTSPNITCIFDVVDKVYVAFLANQRYMLNDRIKIYGKHRLGMANQNVAQIDASNNNNSLEIFPTTLLRIFPNVVEVKFENVGLKQLSQDSFKYGRNIERMIFGKDAIKIGPSAFRQCPNIKYLEFNENDLSDIDTSAFEGLENLKVLKLNNVKISSVFVLIELLKPFKRLEEIHITNNNLALFPVAALDNMALLRVINMSHNHIDIITNEYVKNKHYLELLDMSFNKVESIERDILENWPNRAGLNLTSNVCIDESFESIGSDDNPTIRVVSEISSCFNDSKIPGSVIEAPQEQAQTDKGESEENESESKEKVESKKPSSDSEIIKKLLESEKQASGTSAAVEEKKKKVSSGKQEVKDEDKHEGLTGSPFDFVKSTESETSVTKVKESDESGSEEVEETTTTTTTTTATPPEPTQGKKKKKKKKNKKNKAPITEVEAETEAVPVVTEAPSTEPAKPQESYAEVLKGAAVEEPPQQAIKIESNEAPKAEEKQELPAEETVPIPASEKSPTENFLHDYEQANGRVFLNADREYHCAIEHATPELKRINVVHIGDHTNENVTSVYFRHSKLHNVPKVVLKTFPNVIHLSIEKSQINAMTHEFFEECGNVRRIDVSHNNVRYVEKNAVKHCKHLEFLDLTGNPLETIESELFEYNENLTVVFGKLKITPTHDKVKATAEKKEDEIKTPESDVKTVKDNEEKSEGNKPESAIRDEKIGGELNDQILPTKDVAEAHPKEKLEEPKKVEKEPIKSQPEAMKDNSESDEVKPVGPTAAEKKNEENPDVVEEPENATNALETPKTVEKPIQQQSSEDEEPLKSAVDVAKPVDVVKPATENDTNEKSSEKSTQAPQKPEVKKESSSASEEEEGSEGKSASKSAESKEKKTEKHSKKKDTDVVGKLKKFFNV